MEPRRTSLTHQVPLYSKNPLVRVYIFYIFIIIIIRCLYLRLLRVNKPVFALETGLMGMGPFRASLTHQVPLYSKNPLVRVYIFYIFIIIIIRCLYLRLLRVNKSVFALETGLMGMGPFRASLTHQVPLYSKNPLVRFYIFYICIIIIIRCLYLRLLRVNKPVFALETGQIGMEPRRASLTHQVPLYSKNPLVRCLYLCYSYYSYCYDSYASDMGVFALDIGGRDGASPRLAHSPSAAALFEEPAGAFLFNTIRISICIICIVFLRVDPCLC